MKRRRSGLSRSLRTVRKRRERRFIKAALSQLSDDLSAGRLAGPADLQDRVMQAITDSLNVGLVHYPYRVSALTEQVIALAIPPSVELLIDQANGTAERRLSDEEGEQLRFRRRLRERWGDAFDHLKLLRVWCLEAGMAFHRRYEPSSEDLVYHVLVRLHARACLVAAEVIALLEAGLASGAHARWRSIHEIAVVGFFIGHHDSELAERYLLHEAVESYRAAVAYQRYADRLNYEPYSDDELAEIRAVRDDLVARFGKPYGTQYGWAAAALGIPRPTFRDIEAAVSLDHLRPYYQMASHPTHAGPKGIAFNLGLLRRVVMLAGPSNAGLADPGHGCAISLMQVTVALLLRESDMGDVVTLKFLQHACDAVGDAFLAASRKLDDEETELERLEQSTGVSGSQGAAG